MPSLHEVLDQEVMWYGQDGFPYKVAEMEQSHRINVQAFLRRRAKNIYLRHQWLEFHFMQDAPEDVFNAWMRENERTLNSDPEEWLNRTPFMQALERAIKNDNTVDGEIVTHEVVVRPGSRVDLGNASVTGRLNTNRNRPPRPHSFKPTGPERGWPFYD